jgi:hypothetical protein
LESITCPGCSKLIRIPDDVLGQIAQCPFCKCQFDAPVRTADGGLTAPVLRRRNPFGERRIAPGVLLFFTGLLSLLTNGFQAAEAYVNPAAFEEQTRDFFEKAAERSNAPELRDKIPVTLEWLPRVRVACALLGLITIAGAVAILRARRHSLAMIGSLAAMFNIANCCCFANILIGGWAIYTLLNPEVRAQFNR